jgi:hypothetical protein
MRSASRKTWLASVLNVIAVYDVDSGPKRRFTSA